jgi:hypothetical protein
VPLLGNWPIELLEFPSLCSGGDGLSADGRPTTWLRVCFSMLGKQVAAPHKVGYYLGGAGGAGGSGIFRI